MALWMEWWRAVSSLRPACTRRRTFLWLAVALAGLCTRGDLLGVTSLVRTLGLQPFCYDRLLDFFHSPAVNLSLLTQRWTSFLFTRLPLLRFQGRPVLLADGIKVPKAGRKMPAVKKLKQVESNTKPEFILGHSCQAISLVAGEERNPFAVPLASRIHEGVVYTNLRKRTLPHKLFSLLGELGIQETVTLVADAFYACKTLALQLLATGSHLISRVRNNSVAYHPSKAKTAIRGRPRKYGRKIRLANVFQKTDGWVEAPSPVYDEKEVTIRYRVLDLLWRPLQRLVRFVLVDHPIRGQIILLCTDLSMPAIDIIRLYGIRFKIEVSFKHALRVVGAYAYHFWMSAMEPISRWRSGDQHLHRASQEYRRAVARKMLAYHRHIQLGLIAQGLLQYLSIIAPKTVWACFGSWLRTIRKDLSPSERVTVLALRNTLPDFLIGSPEDHAFTKFLREHIDTNRSEGLRLIA